MPPKLSRFNGEKIGRRVLSGISKKINIAVELYEAVTPMVIVYGRKMQTAFYLPIIYTWLILEGYWKMIVAEIQEQTTLDQMSALHSAIAQHRARIISRHRTKGRCDTRPCYTRAEGL